VNDPAERFTALYDRHYRSVLGYTLMISDGWTNRIGESVQS
jgi:hypothetical protein